MTLVYLDESGFSPALPVCRSWALCRERVFIPHESDHHQRVNVMAALITHGDAPSLTWMTATRTFCADDVLHLIENGIPRGRGALVVVSDNAGIHRSRVIQAARRRLRRRGIEIFYLPSYAPELNAIEVLFGTIKHHDLSERTYLDIDRLSTEVDGAFARAESRLKTRCAHKPRQTA